jgi:hydrogenase maturation protease
MRETPRILLFGIGNSGRSDDGLGWSFIDEIKDELPKNFDFEYRYQLQVEDAELASHYEIVYFIDAHKEQFQEGFILKKCSAKISESFTTHELNPQSVLHLTKSIYNKNPKAFLLGISGKKFDLEIGLSFEGKSNLDHATSYFKKEIIAKQSCLST